jgi:Cu(I)/Ag(I) efflux system membrane fusion protein
MKSPKTLIILILVGVAGVGTAVALWRPSSPVAAAPGPQRPQLEKSLEGYERIRGLLARDTLQGLAPLAQDVAGALEVAGAAAGDATGDVRRQIESGTAAALKLRDATTLGEARADFGGLSQALVALASADPSLQDGWHVFECPMAEGFPKWVQRSEKLENPYMGQKMLACGTRSQWATGEDPSAIAYHTCPMHPSVKQSTGGTCPICGMNLVPVTKQELNSGVIIVDDVRRQRIGVKTAKVSRSPLGVAIRALGKVTWDEKRLEDVTVRVAGFIKDLRVGATGEPVRKGQVLFTLYSPELFASQQEYLLALKRSGAAGDDSLLKASRSRLRQWGLDDAQIDAIARRGEPLENVPFLAPSSGNVIEKNVVEGAAVEPGMKLFRIAPLDRVWVEAEVYEADLPHVQVGQSATVNLPFLPGRTFEGKVDFVYPYLAGETRTGRIRVELANPKLELKPDMYADVAFHRDLGERLLVPASAVIYTGPRRLVFVDLGDGRLKPQEVELGVRGADAFEVLGGLQEGDVVVTSGNFLIAAESRLRGGP